MFCTSFEMIEIICDKGACELSQEGLKAFYAIIFHLPIKKFQLYVKILKI